MPQNDHELIKLKRGEFSLSNRGFRDKWNERERKDVKPRPALHDLDHIPQKGKYRQTDHYLSLEQFMPSMYGVDPDSIPRSADSYRRGLANQLQAYLLFFDQILANSFAQLEGVHHMLSFRHVPERIKTQFNQDLNELSKRGHLLKGRLPQVEDQSGKNNRRQMLLNYLLTHFSEELPTYELLNAGQSNNSYDTYLTSKVQLLDQYPELSYKRSSGMDFRDLGSVSAFKKRIQLFLAHLKDGAIKTNNFLIVEHILLRPLPADVAQYDRAHIPGNLTNNPPPVFLHQSTVFDPFQLQLSIVFERKNRGIEESASEQEERNELWAFIEGLIRTELPAHLQLYAFQLEPDEFEKFEGAYQSWRQALQDFGRPLDTNLREKAMHLWHVRETRNQLIDLIDRHGGPFGQTYPILDLPAEAQTTYVKEGDQVSVHIELPHSQPGVYYQLWNKATGEKSGMQYKGTGGPLILISDKIDPPPGEDVESFEQNFDIQAIKPLAPIPSLSDLSALNKILPIGIIPDISEITPYVDPDTALTGWMQTEVTLAIKVLQLHQDIRLITQEGVPKLIWPDVSQSAILRISDPEPEVHYQIYMRKLSYEDLQYGRTKPTEIPEDHVFKMGEEDQIQDKNKLYYWIDPSVLGQNVSEEQWIRSSLGETFNESAEVDPHLDIEIPLHEYYHDCLIRVEASFEEAGNSIISDYLHKETFLFQGPRKDIEAIRFENSVSVNKPQNEVQYQLYFIPNSASGMEGNISTDSWVLLDTQAFHLPREFGPDEDTAEIQAKGSFRIGVDMVQSMVIGPDDSPEEYALYFDLPSQVEVSGKQEPIRPNSLRIIARKIQTGLSTLIEITES